MSVRLLESINDSYLTDVFQNKAPLLAVFGGAAAGKSKAVAQKNVLRTLLYHNERILVVRKTLPALKLTCLRMIEETLHEWQVPYTINHSDLTIRIRDSEIIFLSIVNTKGGAAERIKSMTDITAIWVEEATELTEDEMTQLQLRLRGRELTGGSYRQLIATFNPIDANHWLHRWVEVDRRMARVHKTYRDNRYLDREYVERLQALLEQDANAHRVYCDGEWGTLEHIIYQRWAVDEEGCSRPLDAYELVGAGVDFGWEHPSAWLAIGIREHDAYLLDEICRTHMTNSEFMDAIQERQGENGWPMLPVVCDCAEPARLEEFALRGFDTTPADKAVSDGIRYAQEYRLHIHPRCVNTLREIGGYQHRVDRNGNALDDPVKWMDDLMDAMRYFLYTYARVGGGGMGGSNV